jgi:cytochrome c biogenesis protein CcmG, thiol:disulfide interchange protein DsbE
MRVAIAAAAAIIVLAAALPVHAEQIAAVGKPVPPFSFTGLDGNKVALQKFAGHPIFVNFFATWCPPCKLELPNIVKNYPAYKARVVFIGLDQEESPDLVRPFLKQFSIQYLVGIDEGQVSADFGVAAIPQSVFIDKHGIVRAIWRGYMPPKVFVQNMALITR